MALLGHWMGLIGGGLDDMLTHARLTGAYHDPLVTVTQLPGLWGPETVTDHSTHRALFLLCRSGNPPYCETLVVF